MNSTYYMSQNLAYTCLTNESVLQGAEKTHLFFALLRLPFNIVDLTKNDNTSKIQLGDRTLG